MKPMADGELLPSYENIDPDIIAFLRQNPELIPKLEIAEEELTHRLDQISRKKGIKILGAFLIYLLVSTIIARALTDGEVFLALETTSIFISSVASLIISSASSAIFNDLKRGTRPYELPDGIEEYYPTHTLKILLPLALLSNGEVDPIFGNFVNTFCEIIYKGLPKYECYRIYVFTIKELELNAENKWRILEDLLNQIDVELQNRPLDIKLIARKRRAIGQLKMALELMSQGIMPSEEIVSEVADDPIDWVDQDSLKRNES